MHTEAKPTKIPSENRDPITGASGAHPLGTGLGAAAGGAVAGATAAAVTGPVGSALGAAVGAVAGGLAGKRLAESFDPSVEDAFWRTHYAERPYVCSDRGYEHYRPAYRYGWEARLQHTGDWDDAREELGRNWSRQGFDEQLPWAEAEGAARDSWDRVEHSLHARRGPPH